MNEKRGDEPRGQNQPPSTRNERAQVIVHDCNAPLSSPVWAGRPIAPATCISPDPRRNDSLLNTATESRLFSKFHTDFVGIHEAKTSHDQSDDIIECGRLRFLRSAQDSPSSNSIANRLFAPTAKRLIVPVFPSCSKSSTRMHARSWPGDHVKTAAQPSRPARVWESRTVWEKLFAPDPTIGLLLSSAAPRGCEALGVRGCYRWANWLRATPKAASIAGSASGCCTKRPSAVGRAEN